MARLLRSIARWVLGLVRRLFLNKPRNAYEGILFEAISATQAQLQKEAS